MTVGLGLALNERQRTLLNALYPLLMVSTLNPVMDLLANTWPMRFDEVAWRFGFLGGVISAMLPIVVSLGLVVIVATLRGDRQVVRVAGILAVIGALSVAGSLLFFGLDALQVRRTVAQQAKDRFDAATFKAMILGSMVVIVAAWFGIRSIIATKGGGESAVERKSGLIVGQ